jgi:GNAT superfamily N-acetyltransferase
MPKAFTGRQALRWMRAFGRRLPRAIEVQRAMQERHLREPHFYVRTVGVRTALQGQGVGSVLMQPTLERADSAGLAAYIEASTERSAALYARLASSCGRACAPEGRTAGLADALTPARGIAGRGVIASATPISVARASFAPRTRSCTRRALGPRSVCNGSSNVSSRTPPSDVRSAVPGETTGLHSRPVSRDRDAPFHLVRHGWGCRSRAALRALSRDRLRG